MRRAVNQNPPSDVSTEVDERLDILLGFYADDLIGVVDVEPFRLRQQPVKTDDLDPVLFCCMPDGFPPLRCDFSDRVGQGVRGDLHPVVTQMSGILKDLFDGPSLKKLVANRNLYRVFFTHFYGPLFSRSLIITNALNHLTCSVPL